jgi:hypothetical protein
MGDDKREREGGTAEYFRMYRSAASDTRMTDAEQKLYSLISYKSKKKGYCWMSNGNMGEWIGKSNTATRDLLRSMVKKGFITKSHQKDEKGHMERHVRTVPLSSVASVKRSRPTPTSKKVEQTDTPDTPNKVEQTDRGCGVDRHPKVEQTDTLKSSRPTPIIDSDTQVDTRVEKKADIPPDRTGIPSSAQPSTVSLFSAQESIQEKKPTKQYPEPTTQDLKDWGILREPDSEDVAIDGRYEILDVPETVEETLRGIAAYASIQAVPAGSGVVPAEPDPAPAVAATIPAPPEDNGSLLDAVIDLEKSVRDATRRWVTHFDRTDSGIARIVAGPPEDRRRELKSLLWTPDGKELARPKGTWSDVVGASREITSLEGSLSAARRRLAAAFAGMPYMDLAKVVSSIEDEKGRAGRSWQENDGVRPVTLPAWTDERESALAAATAARDAAKPAWETKLRAEQEAGKAKAAAEWAALYAEWRRDAQSKPAREPEALLRLWRSECRRLRNCGKFQTGKEEISLAGDCLRRLDMDDVGAKESGPVREILLRRWIRWHAKESLDGNSHKYTLSVGDLLVSWAAFRTQERVQDYRDLGSGGLRGWLEGARSEAKRAVAA